MCLFWPPYYILADGSDGRDIFPKLLTSKQAISVKHIAVTNVPFLFYSRWCWGKAFDYSALPVCSIQSLVTCSVDWGPALLSGIPHFIQECSFRGTFVETFHLSQWLQHLDLKYPGLIILPNVFKKKQTKTCHQDTLYVQKGKAMQKHKVT